MRGSSPRELCSIQRPAPTFLKKRIPKLTKVINLNIDFQSTQPLYCEFMRADKLEFNISYSDSTYPDNASKLRVFCYMKNGGYAFGDEFEDKYSATFDSTRTSKYSGYGTITIQLLDAEENLINSANVVCKIIESNSTTPFVVSPDFTEESKREVQAIVDDGKAQIVEATKEAKAEIDGWTDQSYRIAKNESDISDLQLFKANTGALHFNGGILSTTNGAIKSLPLEFSIAFRLNITKENWDSIPTSNYKSFIGFPISGYSEGHFGFSLKRVAQGIAVEWRCGYDKTTASSIGGTSTIIISNLGDYFKGDWVNVILSVSKDSDNKYYAYLYFDGKQMGRVVLSGWTGISAVTYPFKINGDRQNYETITAPFSIADVLIFNFDITSADAPYTIADYQQGKPIPPSALEDTLLALENYTVTNGTKKYVLDYSGNNNDAEISGTGTVKGDNDNRVQTLIEFITTLS